jgi:hypothetical protein
VRVETRIEPLGGTAMFLLGERWVVGVFDDEAGHNGSSMGG